MNTETTKTKWSIRRDRAVRALIRLGSNPWCLFSALLLINAVALPYLGLVHDARLYAVQVLDHVKPGLYADDLYLRYGSQDAFSIFSRLVGPVVKQIGLRPTFFAVYLLSNALLLYGAQRFVFGVIRWRLTATLALIYVAVNPLPFGGLGVFHVNEEFLTPRVAAVGLVLLGLERLLHDRWKSLALLGAAMVLHPLMAFGGLLVWICFTLMATLSWRWLCALVAVGGMALVSVLLYYPLGSAALGPMDDTWRSYIHAANFYATPAEWMARDWLRIATALTITFAARAQLGLSQPIRRLLDSVLIVAMLGIVGGIVAPYLPYALPFQGQPYRALWLLQFVQIPLLVALVRHVWLPGKSRTRPQAMLIGGAFAAGAMNTIQLAALLGLYLTSQLHQILARACGDRYPRGVPLTTTLAIAVCVCLLFVPLIGYADDLWRMRSPLDPWRLFLVAIGPLCTWFAALALLAVLYRWLGVGYRFRTTAIAAYLAIQTSFGVAPHLPLWGGELSAHKQDTAFLRQFLANRHDRSDGLPTVYWTMAPLDDIWVDFPAKSFFVKDQIAGSMFNRGTAIEGRRRAHIVRPFELSIARRCLEGTALRSILRMYDDKDDMAEPTVDDLYRLCREDIDIVIIPHRFDGLCSAKTGLYFVYECHRVRDQVRHRLSQSKGPSWQAMACQP